MKKVCAPQAAKGIDKPKQFQITNRGKWSQDIDKRKLSN